MTEKNNNTGISRKGIMGSTAFFIGGVSLLLYAAADKDMIRFNVGEGIMAPIEQREVARAVHTLEYNLIIEEQTGNRFLEYSMDGEFQFRMISHSKIPPEQSKGRLYFTNQGPVGLDIGADEQHRFTNMTCTTQGCVSFGDIDTENKFYDLAKEMLNGYIEKSKLIDTAGPFNRLKDPSWNSLKSSIVDLLSPNKSYAGTELTTFDRYVLEKAESISGTCELEDMLQSAIHTMDYSRNSLGFDKTNNHYARISAQLEELKDIDKEYVENMARTKAAYDKAYDPARDNPRNMSQRLKRDKERLGEGGDYLVLKIERGHLNSLIKQGEMIQKGLENVMKGYVSQAAYMVLGQDDGLYGNNIGAIRDKIIDAYKRWDNYLMNTGTNLRCK
ncbi:MAG: hypothetical protein ABIJ08_04055 [Nanoarchaeota archaeon]